MQYRISNFKCATPRQLICSVPCSYYLCQVWKHFSHPSPPKILYLFTRLLQLVCYVSVFWTFPEDGVMWYFTVFLAFSPCCAFNLMSCLKLGFTIWCSALIPGLALPSFVHLPHSYSHCPGPPSVTLIVGFAIVPLVTFIFLEIMFLHSPGCSVTQYVDQAGLELTGICVLISPKCWD